MKKKENYKLLTSILESIDIDGIISATTASVTLSVTGVGLVLVPISAGVACALSLGNKVLQKIVLNKYTRYEEQNYKDQQTSTPLRNYRRKFYEITEMIKMNIDLYVKISLNTLLKQKRNVFHKNKQKHL